MFRRLALTVALVAVVAAAQESTPDPLAGSVKDRVYTNPYLGMSLTIPKDWTDNLEWKVPKGAEKAVADRQKMLRQHRVALWAMRERIASFGGRVIDTGRPNEVGFFLNTQVLEQLEVRVFPLDGAEPEKAKQERLEVFRSAAKRFAMVAPITVAGLSFARVDYETSGVGQYADKTVYRTAIAAVRKDQVLVLAFSAGVRKDVEKRMSEVLPTLHLQ